MERRSLAELLHRCAGDFDARAWEEFVIRLGSRLRTGVRSAFRRAGCRCRSEDLEDILQDVYFRLLRRDREALRGVRGQHDAEVEAYFQRLAQRVAFDFLRARGAAKRGWDLRKSGRDENFELDSTPGRAPGPERELLWREEFALLEQRCRRALAGPGMLADLRLLRWVYIEGLSSREISDRLDGRLAPSGVDTRIHRLRVRLSRAGIQLPRRSSRAVA